MKIYLAENLITKAEHKMAIRIREVIKSNRMFSFRYIGIRESVNKNFKDTIRK